MYFISCFRELFLLDVSIKKRLFTSFIEFFFLLSGAVLAYKHGLSQYYELGDINKQAMTSDGRLVFGQSRGGKILIA
jgi:hypothetical protein